MRGPGRLKCGRLTEMMSEEANMISEEAKMMSEEAKMISGEAKTISEEAKMDPDEIVMARGDSIRFYPRRTSGRRVPLQSLPFPK